MYAITGFKKDNVADWKFADKYGIAGGMGGNSRYQRCCKIRGNGLKIYKALQRCTA
jgi:hypothetical protein